MRFHNKIEFTKDNLDIYFKAVAKEYRKRIGKNMSAEMILIGGASVFVNYGFRNMTTDIDALIHASSVMKEAINFVGDQYGLPNGWLNDEFKKTSSFSPKLVEYSQYYRTYSNVLTVRTVSAEYLIAMKLRSGRQYKSDLSDVLGILAEHEKNGKQISLENIQNAATDLYGGWEELPEASRVFIANVINNDNYEELYQQIIKGEKETKNLLVNFENDYPGVAKIENANDIVVTLQKKTSKSSILSELRTKKDEKNGSASFTKKDEK